MTTTTASTPTVTPSGTMRNLDVGDYTHITVTPIAGSLGAEIGGVDLERDLIGPNGAEVIAEIRRAWLDHLVVFFRGQGHLDDDGFVRFARTVGTPVEYPFVRGFESHPEIIAVKKLPHETTNFGGIWHSDTTYLDQPPMGTMLIARQIPPAGGDTMFANQYQAFEALSPAMQELLTPLRGISSSALADVSKTREDRLKDSGDPTAQQVYEASHPVVRTHPETSRQALFVNIAHTARFDGMTEDESRPLLQYLFQHQVRPEFTVRFRWEVGSIAMWDNRCAMHNPVNDYHGHLREMHRVTLQGDTPT